MSSLTSQEKADLLQLASCVHPDLDRTLLAHLAGAAPQSLPMWNPRKQSLAPLALVYPLHDPHALCALDICCHAGTFEIVTWR